jgi:hypothetical protein
MDESENRRGEDAKAAEETLTRTELQIEQEKLKLERERILLERERLEAVRDRVRVEQRIHTDNTGKLSVPVSTLTLVSIICLLVGGILGAFSTSIRADRRSTERLQEVMQTLATVSPESVGVTTNESAEAAASMPAWLKAMKPKSAHAGISLVVIQ